MGKPLDPVLTKQHRELRESRRRWADEPNGIRVVGIAADPGDPARAFTGLLWRTQCAECLRVFGGRVGMEDLPTEEQGRAVVVDVLQAHGFLVGGAVICSGCLSPHPVVEHGPAVYDSRWQELLLRRG